MAYRFNGTTDEVSFALAPISGYTAGGVTFAIAVKLISLGSGSFTFGLSGSNRHGLGIDSGGRPLSNGNLHSSDLAPSAQVLSTGSWYIVALTWGGSGSKDRFHLFNGTSWLHGDGANNQSFNEGTWSSETIKVGNFFSSQRLNGDVVCAGIKKADRTDAQIEALTLASFTSWQGFGFDWLAGFETSAAVQDSASPGTGDETARVGTTLVADPSGWAWAVVTTRVTSSRELRYGIASPVPFSGGGISLYRG